MGIDILIIFTSAFGTCIRYFQDKALSKRANSKAVSVFIASLVACFFTGIFNALFLLSEISFTFKEVVCAGFLCGYSSFAVIGTAVAVMAASKGRRIRLAFYSLSLLVLSLCLYFMGFSIISISR